MEKAPSHNTRRQVSHLCFITYVCIQSCSHPAHRLPSHSVIQVFHECTEVLMHARLWPHAGDRPVKYHLFLKEVTYHQESHPIFPFPPLSSYKRTSPWKQKCTFFHPPLRVPGSAHMHLQKAEVCNHWEGALKK